MNRGEIRQAILDELSKTSTDTFHTTAILNRFIQRAVDFVAKYKPWEQTQTSYKFTPTLAGDETDEYWNYPENFYTDSIYRLAVGTGTIASDVIYKPLTFEEYLNYKEDPSSGEDKKLWSDHKRQYFISPRITGSPVITVWGHAKPDAYSDDADEHPFIDDALLDEAILQYALGLAYIKMRGSYMKIGNEKKAEAIALMGQAWGEQRKRQAVKRTENAEIWEHRDFMNTAAGNRITRRGSFNLDW